MFWVRSYLLLIRKGLLILRKQFSSCWYKNIPAEINEQYCSFDSALISLYVSCKKPGLLYVYFLSGL